MKPRPSAAALVLALAVPAIFLHTHYQPHASVGSVDVYLTDGAILVVAAVAFADGVTHGFAPLRAGLAVWTPGAAFLALLVASVFYARALNGGYAIGSHLTSAAKFCEYALLAPSAVLALRRPVDRRALFWAVVLWSSFLTLIAVLQFFGVVDEFKGRRPGQREPSYIGIHDLGAFSGAALSLALAALLLGLRRTTAIVGGISGAVGIAVAAAFDAVGGMVVSAALLWALARRRAPVGLARTAALVVLCGAVAFAAASLRSSAIDAFLRFVGVRPETEQVEKGVQTYAHRTLLGYIGLKIWLDHPLLGVGWQGSAEPAAFEPHLDEAHARFPDETEEAFPSRTHPWGVQNGVIQTLADLGAVGLLLLAAAVAAALLLAVRAALRAPPDRAHTPFAACAWIVFALAVFTGSGLLPGIPVDALLWLSLGLAVALHHSLKGAS
jgi:hypothetical protein